MRRAETAEQRHPDHPATPRYVFWNFVSSSHDRINQAKEDWKSMRIGTIPGDDREFIPLPEKPITVSYP
ncbi:MAG TPA: pirin-like C-terminal cupin domain-containing protein [Steroidobacteraceae bacterium]